MARNAAVVALLLLGVGVVHARGGQIIPKVTAALAGTTAVETTGLSFDGTADPGFAVAGEYLLSAPNNVQYGGGLEYQLQRRWATVAGIDVTPDNTFNYAPIYATAKLLLPTRNINLTPFVKGNLGYNAIFSGNEPFTTGATLTGGLYYAIGAGLIANKRLDFELMYNMYRGTVSAAGINANFNYGALSLSAGYNF